MDTRTTMRELNALFASVENVYMTIARANGLSYNALMMLLMLNDDPKLTQKKVCDALYLPKSSVHTLLTDLMRNGHLMLTEGSNKKEKYIAPTDSGRLLVAKVVAETEKIESEALSSVSEQELAQFVKTAQTLVDAMVRETQRAYKKEA